MEPNEEILKALDEYVDYNLDEACKRRIGKRSSILKQPRLDDDQSEDPQKRKSITAKRRVSFADKFQVMELCTGNVYDIPGRSISASDSALGGESKAVSESEIPDKIVASVHISRNEIKVSATAENYLIEDENNSLLPFSKKHKMDSNGNIEPKSKKLNISETSSSPLSQEENVFVHQESQISEWKKFLFGNADINKEKDQNMEMTFIQDADTNLSITDDDLQQRNHEEKLSDLTNSEGQNKSFRKYSSITKQMHNDYDFKNEFILGNKVGLYVENKTINSFMTDNSKVEVPLSLSDVSLEENKENIFVDAKNKKVLVTNTNAMDLKLKEKLALKTSQASKPVYLEPHIGEKISFSLDKILKSSGNFNSVSVKEQNIPCKQDKKSALNKTQLLNHSMELTCFPSGVANELGHSMNDDYIVSNRNQLNKTQMDTTHFMDLTCNDQNVTGSLSSSFINGYDTKKLSVTNPHIELTENSFDKDVMQITCNTHNISDSLLVSTETDYIKEPSAHCTKFNSDNERGNGNSVDRYSKTKYFSSYGMELTCDDEKNLNIYKSKHSNLELQSVKTSILNNEVSDSDKRIEQYQGILENSCTVGPVLTNSEKKKSNSLQDHEKTQFISDEMELTCYEKNISFEDDVFDAHISCKSNINSKDIQPSKNKLIDEDYEISQVNIAVRHDSGNMQSNVSFEKVNPVRNQIESESLHNTAHIPGRISKSNTSNRTQFFSSDYMELTSKTSSEETEFKKNSSVKSSSKTKYFSSFGMDLTCNSISGDDFNHAGKQSLSHDNDEDVCSANKIPPVKHQSEFMYDSESFNITNEQLDHIKEKGSSLSLSNIEHSYNHSHDVVESTSKSCLVDDVKRKNISHIKKNSNTNHFSFVDMDLTCNTSFNTERRCLPENETITEKSNASNKTQSMNKIYPDASKILSISGDEKQIQNFPKPVLPSSDHFNPSVNITDHFIPDFPNLTSNTCIGKNNTNSDFVQSFQKANNFSSLGMELSCDLQNVNESYIELVPNSISGDSILNSKYMQDINIESGSNVTNIKKPCKSQNNEKYEIEKQSKSRENCISGRNLAVCMSDKKLDSNSELPEESSNSCFEQGVIKDSHTENKNLQHSCVSLKVSNLLQNPSNTNKRLKSSKPSNISDKHHEPDNKLMKISDCLEPGIVYAIKQVKGVNQALPNDYNVFKFPEVFFSLKRNLKPKTSFSCPKIQLTKAVREAIRQSCSFSYIPKDWSPEFSEKSVGLSKNSSKVSEKPITPPSESAMLPGVSYSPQVCGTWSRTKTVTETVHVYPGSHITQATPISKTNISIRKDGSLRKDNFSVLNKSPDTIDCLRKSLDFENEINSSGVIISHVLEESIIQDTAVVATTTEDMCPDGSKLNLDCSISLVPNDDTFSNLSMKLNSKTVNEFSSTSCLNQSSVQSKKNSPTDVTLNSPNNVMNTFTLNSTRLVKKSILQEQVFDKNCTFNVDVTQPILSLQNNKNNQNSLPDKCNLTLFKQKNSYELIENGKIVPDEEDEKNNRCNVKSLDLSNRKTDTEKCSNISKKEQKTFKSNERAKAQMKKLQESTEKYKDISNNGSIQTLSESLNKPDDNQFSVKQKSHSKQSHREKTKETEISIMADDSVEKFPKIVNQESNSEMKNKNEESSSEKESLSKENMTVFTSVNKHSLPNETCESAVNSCLNPQVVAKVNAKNIYQNSFLEKSAQDDLYQRYNLTNVLDKGTSRLCEDDSNDIIISKNIRQCPDISKKNISVDNSVKEKSNKQEMNKNEESNNPPSDPEKHDVASFKSSKSNKSLTKLNDDEVTLISSSVTYANQIDITDKNSNSNDVNMENSTTLQDNSEKNKCLENPFEKIHILRKQFLEASKSENCLWCLKELDDKGAVFEILGESMFACYLMCVDLDFISEIALCTQIAFIHLKEEPDDVDELGFSLFQLLIAKNLEKFPFPAHELLKKLPKFVDFALSAKLLIKDVSFIAVRHEISIKDSPETPILNVQILNENHFSLFNLSIPISLKSYPNGKITPEVTHLEYNVIKKETVIDAVKKIEPGKKYLFRLSEAANDL